VTPQVGGWGVLQGLLGVVGAVARSHGTTIAAVASRYVLDQPGVAAVILGSHLRNDRHAQANAQVRVRAPSEDSILYHMVIMMILMREQAMILLHSFTATADPDAMLKGGKPFCFNRRSKPPLMMTSPEPPLSGTPPFVQVLSLRLSSEDRAAIADYVATHVKPIPGDCGDEYRRWVIRRKLVENPDTIKNLWRT
jgi:hypothetical protein